MAFPLNILMRHTVSQVTVCANVGKKDVARVTMQLSSYLLKLAYLFIASRFQSVSYVPVQSDTTTT